MKRLTIGWKAGCLMVLLLAAAIAGTAHRQHKRYQHFTTHDPGRVYRCAWLEADALAELVQTHGIKTVINLCEPGEMGPARAEDERRAVEAVGAKLLALPMPPTADPADPGLAPHIAAVQDPANYPLLVHCQHGVNRTARLLSIYDVLIRRVDAEASVRQMPGFGRPYDPLEYEFARNITEWSRQSRSVQSASEATDAKR